MSLRPRLLLAVAVSAAAGAATAVAASAHGVLTVTPSTVRRGQSVLIRGNAAGGCAAGDSVTIMSRAFRHRHFFAGVPAVFARVRQGGRFSVATTIPAGRAPGRYGITARCGGGNLGVDVILRVLA